MTEPAWMWPWHVQLRHGPLPCSRRSHLPCRAKEGDVLIETKHKARSSADLEIEVCRDRLADPNDHAGSLTAWGPDLSITERTSGDGGHDALL